MYLEAANCSTPLSQPSRLIRGGTSSTRCSASTKEQRHVVCAYQSTLRGPVGAAILCHGQPIDMNQCTEDVFRSVWVFQHESRSFPQLLSLARLRWHPTHPGNFSRSKARWSTNTAYQLHKFNHAITSKYIGDIVVLSPHVIGISKECHVFIEHASTILKQVI